MGAILNTILSGFGVLFIIIGSLIIAALIQLFLSFLGGAINEAVFNMEINEYSIWHTVTGNIFAFLVLVICYLLGLSVK